MIEMEFQGGAGAEGAVLQAFTESEEVLSLLGKLPSVVSELHARENAEQRFTGGFVYVREEVCSKSCDAMVLGMWLQ